MLTQFFATNRQNSGARQHTYQEFPQHFVWHLNGHVWMVRKRGFAIGRIYFVALCSGEQFYLRMLLITVKGPLAFTDLHTFNGVLHPSFYHACLARGLLQNDNEWRDCLLEASMMHSGDSLCHLFALILKHCEPSQPDVLWVEFRESLCDDLPRWFERFHIPTPPIEDIFDFGLFLLNRALIEHGTSLSNYPSMPLPRRNWDTLDNNPFVTEQQAYDINYEILLAEQNIATLNADQFASFNAVFDSTTRQDGKLFFIDGPGGTGKTFIYNTLCHRIRGNGWIVLCVASSGIAALLLPGGRTAHSTFAIPTQNLAEDSSCNIDKDSKQGDMLRIVRLIIWDEAPMQHRYVFLCVEFDLLTSLANILSSDMPLRLSTAPSGTLDRMKVLSVELPLSSVETSNRLSLSFQRDPAKMFCSLPSNILTFGNT
jgi:PIF1-like helicase